MNCYIAAEDGIYTYTLTENAALTLAHRLEARRPMYFALEAGTLYALLRGTEDCSQLLPVALDGAGLPWQTGAAVPTLGGDGCHLCVAGDFVFAANYGAGNLVRLPLGAGEPICLQHTGCGSDPERQEGPHTHYIAPMPGGKFLAACDLGLDTVFVYDHALREVSRCRLPDGCGPRHLCFSPDGKYAYCANELSSTVSVLACCAETGSFTHLYQISTRREDHPQGANYPAAIRCEKGFVYVSNRGDDDVAVFRAEGEALTYVSNLPAGGAWPRDMLVWDDLLLCANEHSDQVSVWQMNPERTGAELVQTLTGIPAPNALLMG